MAHARLIRQSFERDPRLILQDGRPAHGDFPHPVGFGDNPGPLGVRERRADLQGHVQTLEVAIQAILTKSPTAAAKIAMAEDHMAGTAAVLAKAIAAQKHLS